MSAAVRISSVVEPAAPMRWPTSLALGEAIAARHARDARAEWRIVRALYAETVLPQRVAAQLRRVADLHCDSMAAIVLGVEDPKAYRVRDAALDELADRVVETYSPTVTP